MPAATARRPAVVILNDTATEGHHGCTRVMAVLAEGLRAEGIAIAATAGTGRKWWRDRSFLAAMARADGIVVNGEGTLHHGRPRAQALLRVAEHPAARAPLFLVNTLYQDNPADWARHLDRFAAIYVRDSRSAGEIAAAGARPPSVVPDLTLCRGTLAGADGSREGVILGDSVDRAVSERLAGASDAPGRTLVPILAYPRAIKGATALRRMLRQLTALRLDRALAARHPHYRPARTADAYAGGLAGAALHVTGRFHGVCYSLLTRTPFVAVGSNSWKTQALFADAGLDARRLLDLDAAIEAARTPEAFDWSAGERAGLDDYLASARRSADRMFGEIGAAIHAEADRR